MAIRIHRDKIILFYVDTSLLQRSFMAHNSAHDAVDECARSAVRGLILVLDNIKFLHDVQIVACLNTNQAKFSHDHPQTGSKNKECHMNIRDQKVIG